MSSCLDPNAPDRCIESVFKKYDKDNSGTISPKELKEILYDLGFHVPDDKIPVVLADINRDGVGKVDIKDFKAWWRSQDRFAHLEGGSLERLTQCASYFKYFDKDMSGSISTDEFKSMHADLVKHNLVKASLKDALQSLDADHNGVVSLNEFVAWYGRADK